MINPTIEGGRTYQQDLQGLTALLRAGTGARIAENFSRDLNPLLNPPKKKHSWIGNNLRLLLATGVVTVAGILTSLPFFEQNNAQASGQPPVRSPVKSAQDIGDSYKTISMYASKDGTHSAAIVELNDGSYHVGVNQYDPATNSFSLQDIRRVISATPRAVFQAEDDANKTCWVGDNSLQGTGECTAADGGPNWTGFVYGSGKRIFRGLFTPDGSRVIIQLNPGPPSYTGDLSYAVLNRATNIITPITGSSITAELETPLHPVSPNIFRTYGRGGLNSLTSCYYVLTFDLLNNTYSSSCISVGGNYYGSSLQEVLDPNNQLRILETTGDKWTTPPNPQGVTVGAVIDSINNSISGIYEDSMALYNNLVPSAMSAFLEPSANKIYVDNTTQNYTVTIPIYWTNVEVIPANDPNNFALRNLLTISGDWILQSGTNSVFSYNIKYLKGGTKTFAWIDQTDNAYICDPVLHECNFSFVKGWTSTIDLSNPVSWKKDKFVLTKLGGSYIYLPTVMKN